MPNTSDPEPVRLRMLDHKSPTGPTCPAFYRSTRSSVVVVGKRVTDPAMRAQMGIADDEDAVEVPEDLPRKVNFDADPDA